MFDPLEHPGLPLERHARHWHELDIEPDAIDALDSAARHRITTMQALQWATARFDRRFAERCRDVEAHRSVALLGERAAQRHHELAARASSWGGLEQAIGSTRAAFDLVTWAAAGEPDAGRSMSYQRQAREDLERLRSYAQLSARSGFTWADSFIEQVDSLRAPEGSQRAEELGPPQISQLYEWVVGAVHLRAAMDAADVEPRLGETSATAAAGQSDWERLVVHSAATCYLYYSFLDQETDPRVRPVWELHLHMELAHLQAASDLLRRYENRDPHEVTGVALPEPLSFGTGHQIGLAATETPATTGRELDLIDLLTEQHTRMMSLLRQVQEGATDERHAAFADLARLIAMHETVEEEILHPLLRRLDPADPLADHLLEQERQISEALADAVRDDAAHGRAPVGAALGDMVREHAKDEEQQEFSRVREAVPPDELRQLATALRVAERAAAAEGAHNGSTPYTVAETADRVRDSLR